MKTTSSLFLLAFLVMVVATGPLSEGRTASPRSKLYVDNAEGDELTIIDPVTFKVIGNVKVGENPHGLARRPATTGST
jgi:YVTN family beta-propeller protein